jgi:hypothetical protein
VVEVEGTVVDVGAPAVLLVVGLMTEVTLCVAALASWD